MELVVQPPLREKYAIKATPHLQAHREPAEEDAKVEAHDYSRHLVTISEMATAATRLGEKNKCPPPDVDIRHSLIRPARHLQKQRRVVEGPARPSLNTQLDANLEPHRVTDLSQNG